MYLQFYGLSEEPFGVTPNPKFLYQGDSHREALASLIYGIEGNCGFMTLIAEPGMGKTTLLFELLQRYRNSADTAFIFQTQCDSSEFMQFVMAECGLPARDLVDMHSEFNGYLARNAEAGRRVILMVDEAQNLDDSVLETVRLLSNFETAEAKLLQIVLAGQPLLEEKLSRPSLLQLSQRISLRSELHAFRPQTVRKYIEHRLAIAGRRSEPIFTERAFASIADLSGGNPRVIDNLCFNALSIGYATGNKYVGIEIVEEAAKDLRLTHSKKAEASVAAEHSHAAVQSIAPVFESPAPAQREQFEQPATSPAVVPREESGVEEDSENRQIPEAVSVAPQVRLNLQPESSFEALPSTVADDSDFIQMILGQQPAERAGTGGLRQFMTVLCWTFLAFAAAWMIGHPHSVVRRMHSAIGAVKENAQSWTRGVAEAAGRSTSTQPQTVAAPSQVAPDTTRDDGKRSLAKPGNTPVPQAGNQSALRSSARPVSHMSEPQLDMRVFPQYPDSARAQKITGQVVMIAEVNESGRVNAVRVVSGHPLLAPAAVAAVYKWRFTPALLNGVPKSANTEVRVNFLDH